MLETKSEERPIVYFEQAPGNMNPEIWIDADTVRIECHIMPVLDASADFDRSEQGCGYAQRVIGQVMPGSARARLLDRRKKPNGDRSA